MLAIARLLLVCLVCATLPAPGSARDKPDPSRTDRAKDLADRARAFVDLLVREDYAGAGKDFDEAMRKALPGDKLKETWQSILQKAGMFQKQTGTRKERAGKYDVVFVSCVFTKAPLDVKVVFSAERQITGLFFVPPRKPAPPYQAPEYVRRDAFREVEVTVGAGAWALPGTLTLPVGDGPFQAVVLVHGSGPQDRDETVGANRPFRDLAWGLASRGIAVLRYEKRTKVHAATLKEIENFTVKEEVLDDVRAAADLLRGRKEIDGKKVFVAGHSLGGMLLPRLGAADPGLAGLISLAGNTRPLEEAIVEQLDYILSLDPAMPEEQKKEIEKLKKQAGELKALKGTGDKPPAKVLFGVPASYWLDLRGYAPAEAAKALRRPLLILQGERDYQVTLKDFGAWKHALEGRKNVTFKSYPLLNHLFIEGKGPSRPAEYERIGHVAAEVVEDIAGWVKKQ